MFSLLFGDETPASQETREEPRESETNAEHDEKLPPPVRLLAIDTTSSYGTNWFDVFKHTRLRDGRKVVVDQSPWAQVSLTTYTDSNCVVDLDPNPFNPIPGTHQHEQRTFIPDFLLIRNMVRMPNANKGDYRNALFGLQLANLPSVNSLHSIYCCLDRPVQYAELVRIQRKLGKENFPLLPINYYTSSQQMIITPSFPLVSKIGHAHAGYGKVKVDTQTQLEDLKSVVAMTDLYTTMEPFVTGVCDLRIQKIGPHYRVWKRTSMDGKWKTNTSLAAVCEEIALQDRYKLWVDEVSSCFGGMDMCAVDVIVDEDGNEYIMEFNDTAMGLCGGLGPEKQDEDRRHIHDVVVAKMNEIYCS